MAKYIGKRIVPIHCGKWDMSKTYEMLSIVLEESSGDSYIARRAVPSGTAISDTYYWMLHSLYSQQIKDMSDQLAAAEQRIKADNDATETAIRQDNQHTRQHVDESAEALTQRVNSAETEMSQQKASFDSTAQQLSVRMDEVLAAGTGDGATEVADARVDAEGNTFDSLGSHIRGVTERFKSALDDVVGAVSDDVSIGMSSDLVIRGLIGINGNWTTGKTIFESYALSINAGQYRGITVTAGENAAIIGILASSTLVNAQKPTYATGYNERVLIPSWETRELAIPDDCVYIVILKTGDDSIDYTPGSVTMSGWKIIPAVDDTLTVLGDAADAKATGDRLNDVNGEISNLGQRVEQEIFKTAELDPASYPVINAGINIYSIWKDNSGWASFFIPVTDSYKEITVTGNEINGTVVCLLQTDDHDKNSSAVYATGTSRNFVPAGETRRFDIPDDCHYISVSLAFDSGTDYSPEKIEGKQSAISEIEDKIVHNILFEDFIGLTVDTGWTRSACVQSTHYASGTQRNEQGTLDSDSSETLMASPFVPISGKMLQLPILWVTNSTFPNYGMSLYDKDKQPIYGRAVSAYANRGENDPRILWVNVYLPSNAKYFRTTYWSHAYQEENNLPDFTYNLLKEIPDEYKPITHELPVDTYMQNAIRRARQLTDIKWTPRVNIPRYSMIYGSTEHFLDWFYADHEYTGIPYSGAGDDETHWSTIKDWGYTHNWVGQHIPIESFVTAARYPNSIMGEKASQSVVSYDSSPYGDVCTALVNYAVDGPVPLRGITNFFSVSSQKNVYRTDNKTIADSDMNDVFIGDFLYTRAHVIIITDILRDKDGNVTHVEMSEETTVGNGNNTLLGTRFGGVARRKMWDINEFQQRYGSYIKFRRTTFYGIPYTRSKYVNTGNERDMETIVDMPLIPYLGEGAIYKVGYVHNSKICIGVSGFATLVVLKDGEEFGTFDVTGLTEISVGFSAEGSYEAYLTKAGDVRTLSCHWTVVV